MTGEVDLLPRRFLQAALGIDRQGLAGLQGVNTCPNLVALYGDSLIAQAFMDGAYRNRAAYNDVNIANALSGQRMIFAMKRAVSGWRSDQILQRFLSDVADGSLAATRAGTLIFSMGTNDLSQAPFTDLVSGTAITLANVADNIVKNAARLIDTCVSLGIQCIFRTLHGASNFTAAQIAAMEDANRKIRALPQARRVFILETREGLRDPLTTTVSSIRFKAGAMTADAGSVYVHEAVGGAVSVGKRLTEIVKAIIPALPRHYSDEAATYSADQRIQLCANPTFAGTGGTLGSGGALGVNPGGGALASMPAGWSITRLSGDSTTTFTVNIREDGDGRYFECVVAADGAGRGVRLQQAFNDARWTQGDVLQGFATIEILAGATNVACACPYIDSNGTTAGTNATITAVGCYNDNAHGVFPSGEGFVFEDATEPLTVPMYDTKGFVTMRALHLQFAAAGSATVRVRRPRLDLLPAVPALAL